jgi:hypothetical protein
MRVVVCVQADRTEAGQPPTQERATQTMKLNEKLVMAGVMRDGAGLLSPSANGRVDL